MMRVITRFDKQMAKAIASDYGAAMTTFQLLVLGGASLKSLPRYFLGLFHI